MVLRLSRERRRASGRVSGAVDVGTSRARLRAQRMTPHHAVATAHGPEDPPPPRSSRRQRRTDQPKTGSKDTTNRAVHRFSSVGNGLSNIWLLCVAATVLVAALAVQVAEAQLRDTADIVIVWQHVNGQVHYWPMRGGQPTGGIDVSVPVGGDWALRGVGDVGG